MGKAFLDLRERGRTGVAFAVGLVVILFFWFGLGSLPLLALAAASGVAGAAGSPDVMKGLDPFAAYVGLNLGFVAALLGIVVAVRAVLRRPVRTLVTPAPEVSWRRIGVGFGLFFALVALSALVEALLFPGRYQWSFGPARFFVFLPVVLVLTPIQTTTEELLFRGYILQWSAGLTRNPIALSVLNGVLFTLPHLGNPEVSVNPALLAANYCLTGLLLALVTLRSNGLEYAIGAHAANNLFSALIANYAGSALTTESLFLVNVLDPVYGLLSLLVVAVLYYWLLFRADSANGISAA